MIKKLTFFDCALLALPLISFSTCRVYAIDSAPPEPQLPVVAPAIKGKPSALDGVVLSPEAVAATVAQKEYAEQQAQADKNQAVAVCNAQTDYKVQNAVIQANADKAVLQAQVDSEKAQADQLQQTLKKEVENRPNVLFWSGLSGAAGIALAVVITYFARK